MLYHCKKRSTLESFEDCTSHYSSHEAKITIGCYICHSYIMKWKKNVLLSECMNSGLTFNQQRGHTEARLRFKVSSERTEKREIDLAIPGLVV